MQYKLIVAEKPKILTTYPLGKNFADSYLCY